ncbi:hypothetical protein BDN70DRAFT_917230 [Pholiota conissans]|uniref:Uncharacterized protein n=1 Tax=Pholiota conissans TaxID=109636 RepID=A0A9P6D6M2_9AGAR|nr:hypothetical protein BDN70DRAFT_917230 [Pholiota conissans]
MRVTANNKPFGERKGGSSRRIYVGFAVLNENDVIQSELCNILPLEDVTERKVPNLCNSKKMKVRTELFEFFQDKTHASVERGIFAPIVCGVRVDGQLPERWKEAYDMRQVVVIVRRIRKIDLSVWVAARRGIYDEVIYLVLEEWIRSQYVAGLAIQKAYFSIWKDIDVNCYA